MSYLPTDLHDRLLENDCGLEYEQLCHHGCPPPLGECGLASTRLTFICWLFLDRRYILTYRGRNVSVAQVAL